MVNKKFWLGMLVMVLAFGAVLSGCASQPSIATLGPSNFYSDSVRVGEKRGEETNTIVLGLFGSGYSYPPVYKVARDNGITRIATVEYYFQPGFLFLWTWYTTIVTGE